LEVKLEDKQHFFNAAVESTSLEDIRAIQAIRYIDFISGITSIIKQHNPEQIPIGTSLFINKLPQGWNHRDLY